MVYTFILWERERERERELVFKRQKDNGVQELFVTWFMVIVNKLYIDTHIKTDINLFIECTYVCIQTERKPEKQAR